MQKIKDITWFFFWDIGNQWISRIKIFPDMGLFQWCSIAIEKHVITYIISRQYFVKVFVQVSQDQILVSFLGDHQ